MSRNFMFIAPKLTQRNLTEILLICVLAVVTLLVIDWVKKSQLPDYEGEEIVKAYAAKKRDISSALEAEIERAVNRLLNDGCHVSEDDIVREKPKHKNGRWQQIARVKWKR